MILGTTKNVCKKKTKLHFGGGECAGVQIIEKGMGKDLHHVAQRGRHHAVPAGGRRCEYLKCGMYAERMDVELDMEMETDCIVYTIPKKLYKNFYDENVR